MRILHILRKFNGGGVEAVVMNYYKHIDRDKYQFDFVCCENSHFIPEKEINELGGKVYKVTSITNIFKYISEIKNIAKGYDIVHCHMGPIAFPALIGCMLAGCKIRILHSHTETKKNQPVKLVFNNVCKQISKRLATYRLACSRNAGDWLYGNMDYIVLNNAIDTDKYKFSKTNRKKNRKELGVNDNEILIGHVGRFQAQKNHPFLIDVFNDVVKQEPNYKLLLIGDGNDKDEIVKKVDSLNINNNVVFLGQIGDVEKYYSAMDVFTLPSLCEGLPVVGVEAQANGLKCFFSDNVSQEALLSNTAKMLPLDKDVWKNELLKCYPLTFHYVNKIKDFDIKEKAKDLEKIYERLV